MPLIISILFLFLNSCSTSKKSEENTLYQGVTLDVSENSQYLNVKEKQLEDEYEDKDKEEITPIISLYLGPGLANTICLIPYLEALEKEQIKIHIISGQGLGLLIGALYSKKGKTGGIEWKIHNLFNELKKESIHGKGFDRVLSRFIDQEFKEDKFYEYEEKLLIPLYSKLNSQVTLLKSGAISLGLKKSLLSKFGNDAFEYQDKVIVNIKNQFHDIFIGVNPLESELKMSGSDGVIFGQFNKSRNSLINSSNYFDHYFGIKVSDSSFDEFTLWPSIKSECGPLINTSILELIEKTENWKKRS